MSTINEIILRITGQANVRPAINQANREVQQGFGASDLIYSRGISRAFQHIMSGGMVGFAAKIGWDIGKKLQDGVEGNGAWYQNLWTKFKTNGIEAVLGVQKRIDALVEAAGRVDAAFNKIRMKGFADDLKAAAEASSALAARVEASNKGKHEEAKAVADIHASDERGPVDKARLDNAARERDIRANIEDIEAKITANKNAAFDAEKERPKIDKASAEAEATLRDAERKTRDLVASGKGDTPAFDKAFAAEEAARATVEAYKGQTKAIDVLKAKKTEENILSEREITHQKEMLRIAGLRGAVELKNARAKEDESALDKQRKDGDLKQQYDLENQRNRAAAQKEVDSIKAGMLSDDIARAEKVYAQDRAKFRGSDASMAKAAANFDKEWLARTRGKRQAETERITAMMSGGRGAKAMAAQWAQDVLEQARAEQARKQKEANDAIIKNLPMLQKLAMP